LPRSSHQTAVPRKGVLERALAVAALLHSSACGRRS
jgi:hypothetical protein